MEKSAEVVNDVVAGRSSDVVDKIAAMVQAKAAEIVRSQYYNEPEAPNEADLTGEEEGEDEDA